MSAPITFGFEYEVQLAVSIPLAWATLLKTAAENHYDYKCREAGKQGVVNALYNTAYDGEFPSNYPVSWRDLDLVFKVAEQLRHHTDDHLAATIRTWIYDTMRAISRQQQLCMGLPGSADKAPAP